MEKNLSFALALAVAALVLMSGCTSLGGPERPTTGSWPAGEVPADYLTYVDEDAGFSIRYPPQWQMQEEPLSGGIIFLSPLDGEDDVFMENVNVVSVEQPLSWITLDQIYDAEIADIKKNFASYETVASEKIMFGDTPAYRVTAVMQSDGYSFKDHILIILKNGREYVVIYTAKEDAYEQYWETAEKVMGSFQAI